MIRFLPMRRMPARTALSLLLSVVPVVAASAQEAPLTRTTGDPALQWGSCPAFMPKGCAIAVLHGDPAKDNADVFFKVPANAVIPRHWHTSAERMVLVAGELHVTYDGHPAAVLRPGTYAYGPAKLPHQAVCGNVGDCVLFIAFESPVDAVAGAPPAR
ncbi:MAG: cupin domain-containing protein [Gammaproteobacteria bacterium]